MWLQQHLPYKKACRSDVHQFTVMGGSRVSIILFSLNDVYIAEFIQTHSLVRLKDNKQANNKKNIFQNYTVFFSYFSGY